MSVKVHLTPPLDNTAGCPVVSLEVQEAATIESVMEDLIQEFGSRFRAYLYDPLGRVVPAWAVFVNEEPFQLNRPENLLVPVKDGDEMYFILNIAGG